MTEPREAADSVLVDAVFLAALELPPDQRERFVADRADCSDAVKRCVLEMLAHAEGDDLPDVLQGLMTTVDVPAAAAAESSTTEQLLARLREAPRLDAQRYEEKGLVGEGGMGAVFLVRDRRLHRDLAIKVMHDHSGSATVANAGDRQARFLEEAQVTSQLEHPGIVPVHELGLDQRDRAYFTMRLVPGMTVDKVFALARDEREGWTRTRALEVVLKVCDTISYAHSRHVVHRDLKPKNVMVGKFGEVYVLDWGCAKVMTASEPAANGVHSVRVAESARGDADGAAGERSRQRGTLRYMAPEQARGEEVDARVDVYAIGALLYELLTGKPPQWKRDDWQAAVGSEPAVAVDALEKAVPVQLAAIVAKAMAFDRQQRYGSVAELADDVRSFLNLRAVQAYRTGAWVEFQLWVRRNAALAAALAGLFVAMLGGGAWVFVEQQQRQALEQTATLLQVRRLSEAADWPGVVRLCAERGRAGPVDYLVELAISEAEAEFAESANSSAIREFFARGLSLRDEQVARLRFHQAFVEGGAVSNVTQAMQECLAAGLEEPERTCALAVLEPDMGKALVALTGVVDRNPSMRLALRLAIPLSFFAGSQELVVSLTARFRAMFPGDPGGFIVELMSLVAAHGLSGISAAQWDRVRAEHADSPSRRSFDGISRALQDLGSQLRDNPLQMDAGKLLRAVHPAVLSAGNFHGSGVPLWHPTISKFLKGVVGLNLAVAEGRKQPQAKVWAGIQNAAAALDLVHPDAFTDVVRASSASLCKDLDAPMLAECEAAFDRALAGSSVMARLIGRPAWQRVLLTIEPYLLSRRMGMGGGEDAAKVLLGRVDKWTARLLEDPDVSHQQRIDAVRLLLNFKEDWVLRRATLIAGMAEVAGGGGDARFWLARAFGESGETLTALRMMEQMNREAPGLDHVVKSIAGLKLRLAQAPEVRAIVEQATK